LLWQDEFFGMRVRNRLYLELRQFDLYGDSVRVHQLHVQYVLPGQWLLLGWNADVYDQPCDDLVFIRDGEGNLPGLHCELLLFATHGLCRGYQLHEQLDRAGLGFLSHVHDELLPNCLCFWYHPGGRQPASRRCITAADVPHATRNLDAL
jgi:hypothetical protein